MGRTTGPLTTERILMAAEETLRRHGPAKATVVDVALALGTSHGSVYRHFPTKVALREAVISNWLQRTFARLADIASDEEQTAEVRLRDWLTALVAIHQNRAATDPELFAAYTLQAQEAGEAVARQHDAVIGQLAQIVQAGKDTGVFLTADVTVTARSVFHATSWFHDPRRAAQWRGGEVNADLDNLLTLIMCGLRRGDQSNGTP